MLPKALKLKPKLIALYALTIIMPLMVVILITVDVSGGKIIEQTTQMTQSTVNQTCRNVMEILKRYIGVANRLCYTDATLRRLLSVTTDYPRVIDGINAYEA